MEIICDKQQYRPYRVDIAEDLVVAISQFKSVNYTTNALKALKKDNIPFSSIILFDGTDPNDLTDEIGDLTYIMIYIRKGIHSLPHLWNILYGTAKLTRAKYMLHQDCDISLHQLPPLEKLRLHHQIPSAPHQSSYLRRLSSSTLPLLPMHSEVEIHFCSQPMLSQTRDHQDNLHHLDDQSLYPELLL